MKAVADELNATIPNAFTGDGVAFLQSVYKDPTIPLRLRIEAAAKAARFERSMRASSNPLPEAEPQLFRIDTR